MEDDILKSLLEKYLSGTATEIEQKELNDWYTGQSNTDAIWESDSDSEERDVEQKMRNHIQDHLRSSKRKTFVLNRSFLSKAAAIFLGAILLLGIYDVANKKSKPTIKTALVKAPENFTENKYITLPDSSTVLLSPGSNIEYKFDGQTRQLSLVGEAYFDIKHIAAQPFIIHTGKVITTVLGTAFNIKAYKGQDVIVSVTRGKVSVTDTHNKTLAILLPNEQVEYIENKQVADFHKVKAAEVITWANADMQLNDMPFKQVAEKLSRRYSVKINFKNPELANCLITGRFNGTESLDKVLQVITETMNYSYKVNGDNITVDGAGCQ